MTTVNMISTAELPTIAGVSYDWRTNTLKIYSETTLPGYAYFLNDDGQAYDYASTDCWETIQNFVTDSECAHLLIFTAGEPTEDDQRAYRVAAHEVALYADCFGA